MDTQNNPPSPTDLGSTVRARAHEVDRAPGTTLIPEAPEMADDPEYQAWVETMARHCRCSHDCPCAGVLAGGLCDGLQDSPIFDEDDMLEGRYDRETRGNARH